MADTDVEHIFSEREAVAEEAQEDADRVAEDAHETQALLPARDVPSAARDLHLGDRSPIVTGLQTALRQLGFYRGGDQPGVFGRFTEDAVKRLQLSADLAPSGRLDAPTRAVMRHSASGFGAAPDTSGGVPMWAWVLGAFAAGAFAGYFLVPHSALGAPKEPEGDPKTEAYDAWKWYERRVEQAKEIGLPEKEIRSLEKQVAERKRRFENL